MVGRRPNHPESAMIALMRKLHYKQGKIKKVGRWNRRLLKRPLLGTGDFYANCIWGPFRGGGPYEMDIAFPDSKLDVEIDGTKFHKSIEQLTKDKIRDSVLKLSGWTVIRITDTQVYRVFVPLLNKKF
jgi:hypothetical protein